ncbi:MAG: YmdB family metallophosphoesterase [Anaerolineae bacterium]
MRILLVGDVIAQPGLAAIERFLPQLRRERALDLVVANGENVAAGLGLTIADAQALFAAGVDVITSGNHIWDRREIVEFMEQGQPVLRPLNYPEGAPGSGYAISKDVLVVSLLGRINIDSVDCPFARIADLLDELPDRPAVSVVDFHALDPMEKVAMGWYLDGRVSAVVGTHTHIPTADVRLLPAGTAFVGDIGMVGPYNSVAGVEIEPAIARFRTRLPPGFLGFRAASGPVMFNSVLVDVDEESGQAVDITRVDEMVEL